MKTLAIAGRRVGMSTARKIQRCTYIEISKSVIWLDVQGTYFFIVVSKCKSRFDQAVPRFIVHTPKES